MNDIQREAKDYLHNSQRFSGDIAVARDEQKERFARAILTQPEALSPEPVAWMAFDPAYMRNRIAWNERDKADAGGGLTWEPLYRRGPQKD